MILLNEKSTLLSVGRLHQYLYDLDEANNELLSIYEDIDHEVAELEYQLDDDGEQEALEEDLKDIKTDLKYLIKKFKTLNRAEILEELERISF